MTDKRDAGELARCIRRHAVTMCARANASHIGSSLSAADILSVLYTEVLNIRPNQPNWPDRDRFIMSKGHAAAVLYAVLAEIGFFEVNELQGYCAEESRLTGHVSHYVPGVEVSTGSLGHGLPIGCGLALAAKRDAASWRSFALLSDGELDEGSTWEAALFAGHHRLDNLIAIIDYNKIQSYGRTSEVLELEPLADKWRAFGWAVREVDGHDILALRTAMNSMPFESGCPSALIAHTIKGKGVSFMENDLAWHYRSPKAEQLANALSELSG